jgi:hypothetical protein
MAPVVIRSIMPFHSNRNKDNGTAEAEGWRLLQGRDEGERGHGLRRLVQHDFWTAIHLGAEAGGSGRAS